MNKTKRAALYVRVSTSGQTTDNQTIELRDYCERQGWSITNTYQDKGVSGAIRERPALDAMLADAVSKRFDVLVVWKIDRLARSVAHLLEILTQLQSSNVSFASATEAIDTASPQGRMLMMFCSIVAEFERDIIRERIRASLNRVRAEGIKKLGRPRTGFDITKAIQLRNEGHGYKQIARSLGIPRTTLYRGLKAIPKTPTEARR